MSDPQFLMNLVRHANLLLLLVFIVHLLARFRPTSARQFAGQWALLWILLSVQASVTMFVIARFPYLHHSVVTFWLVLDDLLEFSQSLLLFLLLSAA